MIKKLLLSAVVAMILPQAVMARHSNYSPMAPRTISAESSKKDFSFGLTKLPGNSVDSLEAVNRNGPWVVNYWVLDRYFLRPIAHGYSHLPEFSKTGIHNFFANISDLTGSVDNLALGQVTDSSLSFCRFSLNTTVGLLGLFDVASSFGIERRPMNMSTVLGRYGVDQGLYLMVPGIGPSTERDVHGSMFDSWPYMAVDGGIGFVLKFIDVIDTRAALIPQEKLIDNAVDSYAQMRQIYLMHAQGKVDPNAAMDVQEDKNVEEFIDEIDD